MNHRTENQQRNSMNEPEGQFLKQINKIDKPLPRCNTTKKKKRLKLLKSEIKMGTLLFYRNKKDYKSVLYPNKLDNLHGHIPRNTKPIL